MHILGGFLRPHPFLRKSSALRTSSAAAPAGCMIWNLSYTIRSGANRNASTVSRFFTTVRELVFLPKTELVHLHLPQAGFLLAADQALQTKHIDGSERSRRQPKLPRHPPPRCTFTGPPHGSSKRMENGVLLHNSDTFSYRCRNSGQCNRSTPLLPWRETHPTADLAPPAVYVVGLAELPPATGADWFSIATLAPHPHLQGPGLLVDLVLVDSIARPPQNSGLVVLSHSAEYKQGYSQSQRPLTTGLVRLLHRAVLTSPT